LLQLQKDFFQYWNLELGHLMADKILQFHLNKDSQKMSFDSDYIFIYLNEKLSKLPGVLEWLARKIIDQIPFVEFMNLYSTKDINKDDKEKIALSISDKINEFQIDIIKSIVPDWTKFIIPINKLC